MAVPGKAYRESNRVALSLFQNEKLHEAVQAMRELRIAPEEAQTCSSVYCRNAGFWLVIVEAFAGLRGIDGVCHG